MKNPFFWQTKIKKLPALFSAILLALMLLLVSLPLRSPLSGRNSNEAGLQALMTQVEDEDKVRVIVSLEADFQPEGKIQTQSGVRSQRARITAARSNLLKELADENVRTTAKLNTVPALGLQVDENGLQKLSRHPLVKSVSPDVQLKPILDETVPHIEAAKLHDNEEIYGEDWTVAILDTGLDKDHPAFEDRVVAEACFSDGAGDKKNDPEAGDCPNDEAEMVGDGAGSPLMIDDDPDPHGTTVGGVTAGTATNSLSAGVAPRADIFSINIAHVDEDGEDAIIHSSDLIKALEHVYENRDEHDIAAVNMSLGFELFDSTCDSDDENISEALQDSIENLRSAEIAPIAASGNNGESDQIIAPACLEDVIAVGATDIENTEEIAGFSNQHPAMVELVAPGVDVTTAGPDGKNLVSQGTSIAAPHVAGAWALLQSGSTTNLGVEEIKDALIKSGDTVVDHRHDDEPAYRSIRLDKVLNELFFTVTFTVEDEEGNPLEGATVEFDGTTTTTDADGKAIFEGTLEGKADYRVEKSDYQTREDEISIVDDTEQTITMKKMRTVELKITDYNNDPLQGAKVNLSGQKNNNYSAKTNSEGLVTFLEVVSDTYDVTVELSGYSSTSGELTVADHDIKAEELEEDFTRLERLGIHGFAVGPNPLRSAKHDNIRFQLKETRSSNFKLKIYTINGSLVREKTFSNPDNAFDGLEQYEWNLLNNAGEHAASGFYLYRFMDLDSGQEETGKLAIIN